MAARGSAKMYLGFSPSSPSLRRSRIRWVRIVLGVSGSVLPHHRLRRRVWVWSSGRPGNLRVLRTHLMRLRRKLGESADSPTYIFTEPRVGYRMPEGRAGGRQPAIRN